jgi:hypothetical protein
MNWHDTFNTVITSLLRFAGEITRWIEHNGRAAEWLTALGVPSAFALSWRQNHEENRKFIFQLFDQYQRQEKLVKERRHNRQETVASIMLYICLRTKWAATALRDPSAEVYQVSHIIEFFRYYGRLLERLDPLELEDAEVIAPWDDFNIKIIETVHNLDRVLMSGLQGSQGGVLQRDDLEIISQYIDEVYEKIDRFFMAVADTLGYNNDWIKKHKNELEMRAELNLKPETSLESKIENARLVRLANSETRAELNSALRPSTV